MIKNYEIRYKDGEEILYIYLDYNFEFAKLNGKSGKRRLKSRIKKYIKNNNIDFKGTTIAVMVGGLMLGTILLNKPISSSDININKSSNVVAIMDEYKLSDELLYDEVVVLDKNESLEDKEEQEKNKVVSYEVEEDTIKEETKKENVKNIIKENVNEVKENVKLNTIEEESKVEEKQGTYINLYRSNGEVIDLELETYIVGVVAAEMPASFNVEALKAQSIVARTYALKCLNSGKRISDSSSTQNYKSVNEMKVMWGSSFNTYYNKIVNAVNSTKGEYLTYNGKYIDAVYHSTSNGYTEDSSNVWGNSFPYLISVESKYDNSNKKFFVNIFMSYEEVSNKLDRAVTIDSVFNIVSRNESGRVSSIEIDGINYSGVNFRTLLGLRSADFDIEKGSNGINITTRGYGHGVGMSQYGANGMANNGYSYKDILFHYYRGVSLNS